MGWPPTVLGGHGEGWDTGGGFKNMVGLAARSEERDPGGGHPLEVHVTQEGAPTDHHPRHPLHLRPRPQAGGVGDLRRPHELVDTLGASGGTWLG